MTDDVGKSSRVKFSVFFLTSSTLSGLCYIISTYIFTEIWIPTRDNISPTKMYISEHSNKKHHIFTVTVSFSYLLSILSGKSHITCCKLTGWGKYRLSNLSWMCENALSVSRFPTFSKWGSWTLKWLGAHGSSYIGLKILYSIVNTSMYIYMFKEDILAQRNFCNFTHTNKLFNYKLPLYIFQSLPIVDR